MLPAECRIVAFYKTPSHFIIYKKKLFRLYCTYSVPPIGETTLVKLLYYLLSHNMFIRVKFEFQLNFFSVLSFRE
jgi:hypothetical protein